MIFPNAKKAASIIVSKMDDKGESTGGAPVKPEFQIDDSLTGLHSAREDMMAAIKEGSPGNYMKAMRSFIDQHHALVNSPMAQTPQREREDWEHAGEKEYPQD